MTTAANDVEISVASHRRIGLVRMMLAYVPMGDRVELPRAALRTTYDMPPAQAREVAAALIDAADRAEGKVPYCRCAAGERSDYEACRECEDGSMSVDGGEQ